MAGHMPHAPPLLLISYERPTPPNNFWPTSRVAVDSRFYCSVWRKQCIPTSFILIEATYHNVNLCKLVENDKILAEKIESRIL